MNQNIRNIAIIAHVDHGKTTLVDELLKEGGVYRANQQVEERAMDSMDLEREKGITIKAKNASIHWRGKTINLVDTPGHADFGGEVERSLKMVDGVLLLVDAYDGPQAQTRFVLRKALQHGLKVIIVVNKIDRENSDPAGHLRKGSRTAARAERQRGAVQRPGGLRQRPRRLHGAQARRKGRRHDRRCSRRSSSTSPRPSPNPTPPSACSSPTSTGATTSAASPSARSSPARSRPATPSTSSATKSGERVRCKITKVVEFSGIQTSESAAGVAGNIVGLSGFEDIDIGDTIAADENAHALPFTEIDPPTIEMQFCINDGPLAGREGKYVTSRQLRERLFREMKSNISIKVADTDTAGVFDLKARGAMQIAILVEQMRREGFEMLVSRPTVITKTVNGQTLEPFESLWVEIPEECLGVVMQMLANRKAQITGMHKHPLGHDHRGGRPDARPHRPGDRPDEHPPAAAASCRICSRNTRPWAGDVLTRLTGTLVATESGESKAYALVSIQERGKLFIGAGEQVYEGMLVGESPRQEDIPVNAARAKRLTNVRSQGEGVATQLSPPIRLSIEKAIEYIAADEFVEATPKSLRLRKRILTLTDRRKAERAGRKSEEKPATGA